MTTKIRYLKLGDIFSFEGKSEIFQIINPYEDYSPFVRYNNWESGERFEARNIHALIYFYANEPVILNR